LLINNYRLSTCAALFWFPAACVASPMLQPFVGDISLRFGLLERRGEPGPQIH